MPQSGRGKDDGRTQKALNSEHAVERRKGIVGEPVVFLMLVGKDNLGEGVKEMPCRAVLKC